MKIGRIGEKMAGIRNEEFLYSKKFRIVVAVVAMLLFALSLIPFIARSVSRQELILFFPGKDGTELYSEVRLAPRMGSPRDRIGETVCQLIQGSMLLDPYPVFPYTTKINQIVVAEKDVYIDLSSEAVKTYLPIERAVEILKTNIRKNFPGYETVTVTVNGNDPVVVNKSLEEKDSEQ